MARTAFRYGLEGRWFKGNTHIHTTRSDGGLSVEQTVDRYASAGYDFIFLTDHWHASDEAGSAGDGPLLVLDGIEIDGNDERGSYYHVVCLGRFTDIERDMGFAAALQACEKQGGMLVLAHPSWTGNTIEDALAHPFHAVEQYNHVCTWLNGKGYALFHWDSMLRNDPTILGLAADDAHNSPAHPGWNGGWIHVRARECTRDAITAAIRAGAYYSTQGPRIDELVLTGDDLLVRTSPVRFARLSCADSQGDRLGDFDGGEMTEMSFHLDRSWEYIRLELEDAGGRRAWSNTLFV